MDRGVVVSPWLIVGMLSLTVGAAIVNWTYHGHVASQLDRIEEQEINMVKTTWISGGDEKSWTSTWDRTNETQEEFMNRHDVEVAAAMVKWPKDIGTSPGD